MSAGWRVLFLSKPTRGSADGVLVDGRQPSPLFQLWHDDKKQRASLLSDRGAAPPPPNLPKHGELAELPVITFRMRRESKSSIATIGIAG